MSCEEHNAAPWPGLKPGTHDPESSALTISRRASLASRWGKLLASAVNPYSYCTMIQDRNFVFASFVASDFLNHPRVLKALEGVQSVSYSSRYQDSEENTDRQQRKKRRVDGGKF